MKVFVLLLAFSLLPVPSPALAAAKNPDTYTYLSFSDQDSMDPAYHYDTASRMVTFNVYETLFFYDGPSTEKIIPLIASKVPTKANGLISKDGKTYTIPIRKGVKFHDGSPLTPEDVRYSIMRFMLQDRDAGPASLLLEPLLGYSVTRDDKGKVNLGAFKDADRAVQVKGDNVVLALPKPNASLLQILADWSPILPKQWAIKNGDWDGTESTWVKFNNPRKESSPFYEKMNGSGPFRLERLDKGTRVVILGRNENYWRAPAKLKRVVIKSVVEFQTRKLQLAAGDADAIYADWPVYSQLQNIPGVQLIENLATIEMNPVIFFTFQLHAAGNKDIGSGSLDGEGIPPDFFSDIDVRKAFAYAMDYQGYIKDVERGRATQTTGAIPKALPGHNPKQAVYTYDLAKAAEHMKKAWKGQVWEKGFKFTLSYNEGNIPRQNIAQILKRSMESLNPKFKIDVRPIQWSTFLDAQIHQKLPIFIMGWNADYPDAHNFAFPFYHSQGTFASRQKFSFPEMDKLVEAALIETDGAKRKAIYAKLQAIAYEKVPIIVLVDKTRYRNQRDWVKGWYHNPVHADSPYGGYFYPIWKE